MSHIKQSNFQKRPTAEQFKVFRVAFGMNDAEIPATRIEAHLKIKELIHNSADRKIQLKTWQTARKLDRTMRRLRSTDASGCELPTANA